VNPKGEIERRRNAFVIAEFFTSNDEIAPPVYVSFDFLGPLFPYGLFNIGIYYPQGLAGDFELFIGGDDIGLDRASGGRDFSAVLLGITVS
jgi:hypothetical protein